MAEAYGWRPPAADRQPQPGRGYGMPTPAWSFITCMNGLFLQTGKVKLRIGWLADWPGGVTSRPAPVVGPQPEMTPASTIPSRANAVWPGLSVI
jgi:hypothetical protein